MIVSLRAVTILLTIVLSVMLHISSRRILGALEPGPPVYVQQVSKELISIKLQHRGDRLCMYTVIKVQWPNNYNRIFCW